MALTVDDSLLNSDALITAFYDSCFADNIGQLTRANNVMANRADAKTQKDGLAEAYKDTLENMTATIKPEDALRDVLLIQINHALDTVTYVDSVLWYAADWFEDAFPDSAFSVPEFRSKAYADTQYMSLDTIANLCPYEYGPAVYMARAMMMRSDSVPHFYNNACEIPAARYGQEEETDQQAVDTDNLGFKLYPNPNTGDFTVWLNMEDEDVAHLHVWSISGQRVFDTRLSNGSNTLNMNTAQGLYLYTVTVNGARKWTGKVAISSE